MSRQFISISPGDRFDQLTAISDAGKTKHGHSQWLFCCTCGVELVIVRNSVVKGLTTSCGCYRKLVTTAKNTTHGLSPRKGEHPLYSTWKTMRTRCFNENREKFHLHGGRGITVCERWDNFELFVADMGPKPTPEHSIERVDNNGNYEPNNCVWATPTEQANNRCARGTSDIRALAYED